MTEASTIALDMLERTTVVYNAAEYWVDHGLDERLMANVDPDAVVIAPPHVVVRRAQSCVGLGAVFTEAAVFDDTLGISPDRQLVVLSPAGWEMLRALAPGAVLSSRIRDGGERRDEPRAAGVQE